MFKLTKMRKEVEKIGCNSLPDLCDETVDKTHIWVILYKYRQINDIRIVQTKQ